jgi:hypothetical protein
MRLDSEVETYSREGARSAEEPSRGFSEIREVNLAEKVRNLAGKVRPRGAPIWPPNVLVLVEGKNGKGND